ncbi:uncharacterized protein LOC131317357 [Rhododendron vialii]|uniref:uncharacterized protein LOC131317357 n=1 Tax=Rhododendron vialii TaxID=182163 RepID=UPI00265F25D7|nr:uncharacterized protein LOC131317357 [Rhododendron vialii]
MSPAAPIEPTLIKEPPSSSSSLAPSPSHVLPPEEGSNRRRFAHLRGVQWRIDLGILPSSSSSSSLDDLRRVTAESRRKYAGLRRRLLMDPRIPKYGSDSPNLVMDNPLSQNPDSMWGRFFRNAELERMVDQDLSRLYPEHGSYFQTPGCQSMLRRILLFWCLRHPECGYRQGMHELLAPLLYVLHADVEHLSQVRKQYEDHFTDKFDGFNFQESDLAYDFDFKKFPESKEDEISQITPPIVHTLDELDPNVQDVVLLSDAYGAEGELGIVLSEKFMEHDAYRMFDALMNGAGGAVTMAEFFSPYPSSGSHSGLPPVIEASSALYHLLSIVDASLYSHLVELGVEPQYFALRWLRVLFGREFSLGDLLVIWDEIFANDNSKLNKSCNGAGFSFGILSSRRGAFISAVAVSMILCVRSSLLATENATSCLQRLLNFPANVNLKKILSKAKSLQVLALEANDSSMPLLTHPGGGFERSIKNVHVRSHSLTVDSVSPRTPLSLVPESYWEEKWRDMHKAEEVKQSRSDKKNTNSKKGWSEKVRLSLSRTESAPSPSKVDGSSKKDPKLPIRRSLLEDLSRQLESEEDAEKIGCDLDSVKIGCNEERGLSGNAGSEDNSSMFSDSPSPDGLQNQSGGSSVASNLSINENDDDRSRSFTEDSSPLPVSDSPADDFSKSGLNKDSLGKNSGRLDIPEDVSLKSGQNDDPMGKPMANLKDRKTLSGKFHWLWKFGRNNGDDTSERGVSEATRASDGGCDQNNTAAGLMVGGSNNSSVSSKGDAVDQNVMITLRNLGQSMLENIQVIDSVFQQESGKVGSSENFSKNVIVGKGQVTAVAALKELRKISNLLSEM